MKSTLHLLHVFDASFLRRHITSHHPAHSHCAFCEVLAKVHPWISTPSMDQLGLYSPFCILHHLYWVGGCGLLKSNLWWWRLEPKWKPLKPSTTKQTCVLQKTCAVVFFHDTSLATTQPTVIALFAKCLQRCILEFPHPAWTSWVYTHPFASFTTSLLCAKG